MLSKKRSIWGSVCISQYKALADLRGRRGRGPPLGPNSFIFMQFSGIFWLNNSWHPHLGGWCPSSEKSCIRHCKVQSFLLWEMGYMFTLKTINFLSTLSFKLHLKSAQVCDGSHSESFVFFAFLSLFLTFQVKEISHQHGWDYNFMSWPVDDVSKMLRMFKIKENLIIICASQVSLSVMMFSWTQMSFLNFVHLLLCYFILALLFSNEAQKAGSSMSESYEGQDQSAALLTSVTRFFIHVFLYPICFRWEAGHILISHCGT